MKTFNALKAELLEDPDFRREYEALEPEFTLIRALIRERVNGGMTQKEIAKKIGTKQSSISRFESGRIDPGIGFMTKLARVFGMKIQIVKE